MVHLTLWLASTRITCRHRMHCCRTRSTRDVAKLALSHTSSPVTFLPFSASTAHQTRSLLPTQSLSNTPHRQHTQTNHHGPSRTTGWIRDGGAIEATPCESKPSTIEADRTHDGTTPENDGPHSAQGQAQLRTVYALRRTTIFYISSQFAAALHEFPQLSVAIDIMNPDAHDLAGLLSAPPEEIGGEVPPSTAHGGLHTLVIGARRFRSI